MKSTLVGVRTARKSRRNKLLRRPRGLKYENLENRLVMYGLTGYQWTNTNVSVSYLPDGTSSEGYSSSLFSLLNAVAPTATWQREFARALQSWANVTNLNFHFVADSGAATGTSGSAQGDSRFGDIRLGAHDLGGPLAYAYYPNSWSTRGGDITMATEKVFSVGSSRDIYSVLLHEIGHAIGLDHSTSGSVMYAYITGVYSGLTADDIAGAQALYGARQHDSFDASAANDSLATASVLSVSSSGTRTVAGDLTSMGDVDYYKLTAPVGTDGTLSVTLDARGRSLLSPKLSVYDAGGNFVTSADAGGDYGGFVTVELAGLTAGQSYYVVADGATGDEFGMGAYQLSVAFGLSGGSDPTPDPEPEPPPGPTGPVADRYEVNDAFASATNLGKFNSTGQSGLSLHTSSDSDYFRFNVAKSGTFNVTALFAHSDGNVDLEIYNAQRQFVAGSNSSTDNESITLNLSANQDYYIRVFSPDGAVNDYDLSVAKTGGGGGGNGGGRGRRAQDGTEGHPTFETEAEELAYYAHDVGHHGIGVGGIGVGGGVGIGVGIGAGGVGLGNINGTGHASGVAFLLAVPRATVDSALAAGYRTDNAPTAAAAPPAIDATLKLWASDARHRGEQERSEALALDVAVARQVRSGCGSSGSQEVSESDESAECRAHDEALTELAGLDAAA
jgi:hypothetical protein